jgi:hypothetical protein
MFPTRRTSEILQRASGALVLLRSFLLLEDDHEIDWEVDQEPAQPTPHPHRAALTGRPLTLVRTSRRPGAPIPSPQVCISPVSGATVGRTAPGHAPRALSAQPRRTKRRALAHRHS